MISENKAELNLSNKKTFALIGTAGFIAPRHLKAIKDTGNELVAALDKFDSVGILDSHFPHADFFTEYERFDRHIDKIKRTGKKIDYVSICTPNYLHDSHIRFALRQNADAICEKPLVLNPWNVEALQEIEKETGKHINTILQLRLHPVIIELRDKINSMPDDKMHDITLTYITSRGKWYFTSWKGDVQKSGGIATNIGVHFFDMLTWIFGDIQLNTVHMMKENKAGGFLQLKKARVKWFLSLDAEDLPQDVKEKNQRTFRSITIDNQELEFSDGFTDLHTHSYREILKGNGFTLQDAKTSIQTVYEIRNLNPIGKKGEYHTFLQNLI
jgi:UDP-N-acetyl-2-amino-2-deoxyglucuronate dehydrogenase